MAKTLLPETSPLGGFDQTFAQTQLQELPDLAIVSLAIPLGGKTALTKNLKAGFELSMPTAVKSRLNAKKTHRLVSTSADQMLLIFSHKRPDAAHVVSKKIKGAAWVTDQTDNWVKMRLTGPQAIDALERICPIDLHTSVFGAHASARTVMEHLGVLIICLGKDDYLLLSANSSARTFLHAVVQSLNNVT